MTMARKDVRERNKALVESFNKRMEEGIEPEVEKVCPHVPEMTCYMCLPSPWGKITPKERATMKRVKE
jgi:hypothetical protein